jgi:hypothetical protein
MCGVCTRYHRGNPGPPKTATAWIESLVTRDALHDHVIVLFQIHIQPHYRSLIKDPNLVFCLNSAHHTMQKDDSTNIINPEVRPAKMEATRLEGRFLH